MECQEKSENHYICDCLLKRMRNLEDIGMKARIFVISGDVCEESFDDLKKAVDKLYENCKNNDETLK